jgi:hypothetical protein
LLGQKRVHLYDRDSRTGSGGRSPSRGHGGVLKRRAQISMRRGELEQAVC